MNNISFSRSSIDPFKYNSSSESDEEEEPTSPAGRIQNCVRRNSFSNDLVGKDKALLERGLADFSTQYPDSPLGKLRARKINATLGAVADKFDAPVNSPGFHREASEVLKDHNWVFDIINNLKSLGVEHAAELLPNQVMPQAINMDHIVEGGVIGHSAVGFHFCPMGHPMRSKIQNLQTNPTTGVMCGNVIFGEGISKFSTIFPNAVQTEAQLINLLQGGQFIAARKNLVLFRANANPSFFYEMILDKRVMIKSAYPIFHYSTYQFGETLQIVDGFEIAFDDFLEQFIHNFKAEMVKYFSEDRLILDVAPLFPEKGIKQGIYLNVEKNFPNLLVNAMTIFALIKGLSSLNSNLMNKP